MARKQLQPFHLREFLSKVGPGRSVQEYRKDQVVYAQGDPADAVFFVQKGRVKLTVVSSRGKSAVVAMVGRAEFLLKDASPANRFARPRPSR